MAELGVEADKLRSASCPCLACLLIVAIMAVTAGLASAQTGPFRYAWVVDAGGPGDETGRRIAAAPDGSLIVAGEFSGDTRIGRDLQGVGGVDLFVAKLDVSGEAWKQPAWKWSTRAGSRAGDRLHDLVVSPDHQIRMLAMFVERAVFGDEAVTVPGGAYAVAALDAQGSWLWAATFPDPGESPLPSIGIGNSGSTFIAGTFIDTLTLGPFTLSPDDSTAAGFLGEIDADGQWVSALTLPHEVVDIAADSDGGVVAISPDSLYRYERGGELQWTIDTPMGRLRQVEANAGGGVTVVGGTPEDVLGGFSVARIEGDGSVAWVASAEQGERDIYWQPHTSFADDISLDGEGRVYLLGSFTGGISFGRFGLSGLRDSFDFMTSTRFAAMLSPEGEWQWATREGLDLVLQANVVEAWGHTRAIAAGPAGAYLTGAYNEPNDFGGDGCAPSSRGGSDLYVAYLAEGASSCMTVSGGEEPADFELGTNYPNPFNSSTTIPYAVARPAHVRIVVMDVLGRTVRVLMNRRNQQGTYLLPVDMTGLPSGTYFYRMEADGFSETRKKILLR